MSTPMMRDPILVYLEEQMPECRWKASRTDVSGSIITTDRTTTDRECIHSICNNDHVKSHDTLYTPGVIKRFYYCQDNLLDLLLVRARTRVESRKIKNHRKATVSDITVSLDKQ